MPSGSLLSETYKGSSLMRQKFHKRERFFNPRQKAGLRIILTRDIGLSQRVAVQLVNRPIVHYKRIEEFISGFVDSLWLAEEQIFLFDGKWIKLIRKLIRKIFCVGTYNLGSLVDQWKEWGNNLFHTLAESTTIGVLRKPAENNIFRRLDTIDYISAVYRGDKSMKLMQHVSHLISSRQMPYMGSSTEEKAWDKFQSVLTSDFVPSEKTIVQLQMAARRVGGICRSIRSRRIPDGVAHISVTSSGEYSYPIAKGAQAAAVKAAMERILTVVPLEDQEEDTPFGLVRHHKGIPIWKTLFRTEPLDTELPFLAPYALIKEQEGRFAGLDRVTGKQIMYVAWKEYRPLPVLRAEVVPEMGNKARLVTISDYWLNILQSPLSHVLIDAMKFHPSVFSSFHRQDQAFEATKGLCSLKRKSLLKGEAVLSSDLQDATNAQQWSVTIAMLRGFIQGFGLSFRPEYVELVLSTIGPRLVCFRDEISILSKVGIMMGEAIAKPSLTLLNLSIEELAFLRHCRAEELLYSVEPAPYRDWRYIHIGGDDHLVKGPIPYLNLITQIHLDAGSHIDPGKHGFSRICVKYTERLLNLSNLEHGCPFDPSDYSRSTIVDSVKVRLLERGQSTLLKKDNKNVAIGKSTQLGGCLEWLPIDDRFYTETKKASIRALFIERMGSLLPRKAVNPRAFAAIHLPTIVGGYGLGMSSELQKFLEASPEPHKGLLMKAFCGVNVKEDLKIFRVLNTNTSDRGVENIQQFQQKIIDQLSEYPQMVNAMDWWELKRKFPDPSGNSKRTIALAADAGILSFEEFAKRATRGNLFQALLMGRKDLKVFNTSPFVRTYKNIVWDEAESRGLLTWSEGFNLNNDEIAIAIKNIAPQWYFDINQETAMDTGHWDPENPETETWDFKDSTYIDKYTEGFPSFDVGFKVLGLRH
uniref:Putative RdRp n=1 Tax=Phakopsora narnavirus C TaxID=2592756 RepID=A0A7G3W8S9_9VIRU|nr:putative RdRp [Phakopsora narnavirus C]